MSKFTPDELWKGIIEVYFEPFMHFFFGKNCKEIDFTKGCEFLDNELQKIYPASQTKNRRADKLLKFWKKSGEEDFILVHVEVQGYEDKAMAERVFNTYYRIYDRYQKPPAVLIIYTNNNPNYHPKTFHLNTLGTKMNFDFKTFKLSEHPPHTYPKGNLFSYVMETAWYDLRKNKLSDPELLKYKTGIVHKMKADGYKAKTIYNLLRFIVHHTRFETSIFSVKLEYKIQEILKHDKHMSILEMEKIKIKEEGKAEGLELSLKVIALLKKGKSIEDISKDLEIPQQKIEAIRKQIEL